MSMSNSIENLAKKLRASGDSNRLKILCILLDNSKVCVSEIAKQLHLDIAIASYHLQALLREKLVVSTREGKSIYYKLAQTELAKDLKNLICKHK